MYSLSCLEWVIFSMSSSNCSFLTCMEISQEAGQVVWNSHLFQNFPQFVEIHTKALTQIIEKKYMFFWNSLAFSVIQWVLAICSLVPLPFLKISLNIWKFMVHMLSKPSLENFEHYSTSMWDECNCAVVWAFPGIAFLCDWKENWCFPVLWPLLSFPNLRTSWVQHIHSISFYDLN